MSTATTHLPEKEKNGSCHIFGNYTESFRHYGRRNYQTRKSTWDLKGKTLLQMRQLFLIMGVESKLKERFRISNEDVKAAHESKAKAFKLTSWVLFFVASYKPCTYSDLISFKSLSSIYKTYLSNVQHMDCWNTTTIQQFPAQIGFIILKKWPNSLKQENNLKPIWRKYPAVTEI